MQFIGTAAFGNHLELSLCIFALKFHCVIIASKSIVLQGHRFRNLS